MSDDASVYVWGCYAIGLALPLTELALLRIRSKVIHQYLGWGRDAGAPWRTAGPAAAGDGAIGAAAGAVAGPTSGPGRAEPADARREPLTAASD